MEFLSVCVRQVFQWVSPADVIITLKYVRLGTPAGATPYAPYEVILCPETSLSNLKTRLTLRLFLEPDKGKQV